MPIAETSRLSLRQLTPEDAPFFYRLVNDPGWLQNIGDRGVKNDSDAAAYIRNKSMLMYQTLGFGMYLVSLKAQDTPIGVCGLVKREVFEHADLGFALLPEFCGKGYAAEAATAVMAYAHVSLGMSRLLAITLPSNLRSSGLLRRLGFQFEGMVSPNPAEPPLQLYAISLLSQPPQSL